MGIRGLTTFIENRSQLFMEKYELHNTNLVVDGNAVAHQLYKWHCKSNDCFGGDYDKYAVIIYQFFQMLEECKVIPYVLYDGGYEHRKVETVINRMKNKISSAEQLNSVSEGSISVFPLFLKDTFQDIALKLNVKCVRCDFECDTEVANIARTLNCPVLSYDSDFFIFDVWYIPFSSSRFCVRNKRIQHFGDSYKYISCEVYKVERFLNSYGILEKTNLPILAVLLGNDYIKSSVFTKFFKHLKIQKCHGSQNMQQKRIKSLMVWLQNETIESAIQKVLSRYKYRTRKIIASKLENAIKGYNCTNSIYLKYLNITPIESLNNKHNFEITVPDDSIDEDNLDGADSDDEYSDDSLESLSDNVQCELSATFKQNFRKCLYPSCFMDILKDSKYYCIPQVENSSLEFAHYISSEILSAIHKILTNSNGTLTCIARSGNRDIGRYKLPTYANDIPCLLEIQTMHLESRKEILFKILNIDKDFVTNCLLLFPESWHLFIITIKYFAVKCDVTLSFIYSLLLCKIFLTYVDTHLGICRSLKVFEKRFENKLKNFSNKVEEYALKHTIIEALNNISYLDSLKCLKSLISFFQIQQKMRVNSKLFDRNLVHSMAQFQSVFLHIKYLNGLLDYPYPNFVISDFYNGTFIYNLTTNFRKRVKLDDYVVILLQNAPSIYSSLKLMTEIIKQYVCNNKIQQIKACKKSKKKRNKEKCLYQNEEIPQEEISMYDPNNKFSLLALHDV